MAARGELAPRAHEQIALLMLLHDDRDPEVAERASATIAAIPVDTLAAFLGRSDAPPETRAFFAARGVMAGSAPAAHADLPLIERETQVPVVVDAGGTDVDSAGGVVVGPDATVAAADAPEEGATSAVQIGSLSVPDKLKLAMRGTREQRGVLIRDSNRLVAAAVLSSPKLTEAEVEGFARMANVADEVLRVIGSSRVWTRNYMVAASLVKNPKTPQAISLSMLPRLNERDVKFVSIDRGVPEVVRMAARKFLAAGQARRG